MVHKAYIIIGVYIGESRCADAVYIGKDLKQFLRIKAFGLKVFSGVRDSNIGINKAYGRE